MSSMGYLIFHQAFLAIWQTSPEFLLKFVVHFEQNGHFHFPLSSKQGRSASSDINSWKIRKVHKKIFDNLVPYIISIDIWENEKNW